MRLSMACHKHILPLMIYSMMLARPGKVEVDSI